ncbi:MAG: glycosyltransferase family 4 protein [Chloroflexota bacterium]
MRILMVAPRVPRPRAPGGPAIVMYAQLKGLLRRNQITLICRGRADDVNRAALADWRREGVDCRAVWWPEPRGLALWRRRASLAALWARTDWPWLTVLNWSRGMQRAIDEALATTQFDVVSVEDKAELGAYRFQTDAPLALTEHEVRHPRPPAWAGAALRGPRALAAEVDWWRWRGFQRRVWGKFHRIHAFTDHDARGILGLAPEVAGRVLVNPFGVEVPPPPNPIAEVPESLVFVGSFGHQPNVDAALWLGREIMPRLRARRPGVKLTLVGSMPPASVRALAGPDIEVTGEVPEVEPYLERAAVVLAPVREGGGQRVKVLQGLAMGRAVVTTSLGAEGIDLSTADGPFLVVADGADEIAASAARLLDDPIQRRELAARARDYVSRHHTPEAFAARMESSYRALAEDLGLGPNTTIVGEARL